MKKSQTDGWLFPDDEKSDVLNRSFFVRASSDLYVIAVLDIFAQ